jgi:hypothetical protein
MGWGAAHAEEGGEREIGGAGPRAVSGRGKEERERRAREGEGLGRRGPFGRRRGKGAREGEGVGLLGSISFTYSFLFFFYTLSIQTILVEFK